MNRLSFDFLRLTDNKGYASAQQCQGTKLSGSENVAEMCALFKIAFTVPYIDFRLMLAAQKTANDDELRGRGIDGGGFRVFRVQGELYPSGLFVHDNAQSGPHEQSIEGPTDLDRYNVGRVWVAGDERRIAKPIGRGADL